MSAIDLTSGALRIHLLGIGGAGMSGIAEILAAMGHAVSGSDLTDSPTTRRLGSDGIEVLIGHDHPLDPSIRLVGVSTAIAGDNPELLAARASGFDVRHRYDLLAAIGATRRTLSVSGTHGKTTTSAMLVSILDNAGLDPCHLVGATLANKPSGTAWTESPWFVLEADESDSTFLAPPRAGAVVTNVEADHLDHHGSLENLTDAFRRFLVETDGPRIVCRDDPGSRALIAGTGSLSYGTDPESSYVISGVKSSPTGTSWSLDGRGQALSLRIASAGMHLVANASAAAALACEIGVEPAAIERGLASYAGVSRRFEDRGVAGGIAFRDDYAHLPTEARAVLSTARAGGWERIVAVVQPHRYSRTSEVAEEFGGAFSDADVVVVTEIYPAGESPVAGVDASLVADAITRQDPDRRVVGPVARVDLVDAMIEELREGDLCLTMGAGDITRLPDEVSDEIERRREGLR